MTDMSNDPTDVTDAIAHAEDAFGGTATFGQQTYEDGIVSDDDWTTQLTKGCQLIDGARTIRNHNGHYTAVIELCFGAVERSLQAPRTSKTTKHRTSELTTPVSSTGLANSWAISIRTTGPRVTTPTGPQPRNRQPPCLSLVGSFTTTSPT
jgi:hypothetical protein